MKVGMEMTATSSTRQDHPLVGSGTAQQRVDQTIGRAERPMAELQRNIMNTAFKSLLLVAALLPFTAQAQEKGRDKPHRGEHRGLRTEEMTKELGLSDEQAAKLRTMNDRYAEEVKAAQPTEAERAARREKMKDIQTRRDAELKSLLTQEQYSRMMEMRQQRHDARREERNGREERK